MKLNIYNIDNYTDRFYTEFIPKDFTFRDSAITHCWPLESSEIHGKGVLIFSVRT
ncbi:hypothetical protein P343_14135 [Sporolactobacillus laevolacticus DSM 442]|uniref:Uncharacterized protein n=1 Tax=Sporolactobacillus laevolacticus DSM 442 TaxID=1395513 RepID=V6IV46_9BACL|nr:hypothetical protein P343_14135 [Sporolactobacillus laevolacticus DSM 442]